jgi:hypothetical protein
MWFCNQYMKVNNNQEWVDCVNICFILVVIDMLELCHFSNTFSCWLLMHSIISIYTILSNFTIPKLKDETTFINCIIFYSSAAFFLFVSSAFKSEVCGRFPCLAPVEKRIGHTVINWTGIWLEITVLKNMAAKDREPVQLWSNQPPTFLWDWQKFAFCQSYVW